MFSTVTVPYLHLAAVILLLDEEHSVTVACVTLNNVAAQLVPQSGRLMKRQTGDYYTVVQGTSCHSRRDDIDGVAKS